MTRLIWIPIAGTIAAVVAVTLARREREGAPGNGPPVREQHADLDHDPGVPVAKSNVKPTPAVRKYMVEVREDASLLATPLVRGPGESEESRYASAAEFLDRIASQAAARPEVRLFATSAKVTKKAIEKVADVLRTRCDVVIQTGVPQTEEK